MDPEKNVEFTCFILFSIFYPRCFFVSFSSPFHSLPRPTDSLLVSFSSSQATNLTANDYFCEVKFHHRETVVPKFQGQRFFLSSAWKRRNLAQLRSEFWGNENSVLQLLIIAAFGWLSLILRPRCFYVRTYDEERWWGWPSSRENVRGYVHLLTHRTNFEQEVRSVSLHAVPSPPSSPAPSSPFVFPFFLVCVRERRYITLFFFSILSSRTFSLRHLPTSSSSQSFSIASQSSSPSHLISYTYLVVSTWRTRFPYLRESRAPRAPRTAGPRTFAHLVLAFSIKYLLNFINHIRSHK